MLLEAKNLFEKRVVVACRSHVLQDLDSFPHEFLSADPSHSGKRKLHINNC